jgi:nucleotide-binding universal stress UspA family protein
MMKTLLLPLFGDASDQPGLATAGALACTFGAHLDVLHIRGDSAAMFSAIPPGAMGLGLVPPGLFEELEKLEESRAARAKRHYDNFCKMEKVPVAESPPGPDGPSACWREATGRDVDVIATFARFRDLLVITNAERAIPLLPNDLGSLLGAGRPVLLAPARVPKSIGRRIVIAWKDTAEAARAISAATPLLTRAEKIYVISVEEDECTSRSSLDSLVEQLQWHRFPVKGSAVSPNGRTAPEALLEAAREVEADLIVMGAYGHNRIREMVFGGFTQHMIGGTPFPIFMLH